ncbi:hypothetical protein [Streptomyces sp. DSM 41634]|uniref:hypothetical protein n=1 Tax=Streptomyces sp. DSM 41634 TaxID=3448656 RepID=UPI0040401D6A
MVAVVMTADAVPRPRLHATTTCTKDGWTYHADLLTRIAHTVISPDTPTGASLTVMDPERWGSVPVGFDAGLLHAYGLRVPAVAARVRDEFAHVLDTPAGRIGELAALCEMLPVRRPRRVRRECPLPSWTVRTN